MASVRLEITGMTCDHCRTTVEQALKSVKGVYAVHVDPDSGSADVDFDDKRTAASSLAQAVEHVGYGARPAT